MTDFYKFPDNGYEIKIVRKEDVLNCIDSNIIDKDIALEIIKRLEIDASDFLIQGKWVGIPHLGNIRNSPLKNLENTKEQIELRNEAREQLDSNQYIMFRRQLRIENTKRIKANRYYRYITSIAASHNRKLYKKLCKEKGECYARIYLFTAYNVKSVDNEYITFNNE